MLVGLGKERDFDESAYRKATTAAAAALRNTGAIDAVSYLTHLEIKGRDCPLERAAGCPGHRERVLPLRPDAGRQGARGSVDAQAGAPDLRRAAPLATCRRARRAWAKRWPSARACALAKNLGNLPGNICTPTYLAGAALALGRQHASIKVKVLEKPELEKLGMGSFLSVARGSQQPPKLIVLEYLQGPEGRKTGRAGRQGPDLRCRRHLHQARRQDGRNEVRHVRRRLGARHLQGRGRAEAADQPGRRRTGYRKSA